MGGEQRVAVCWFVTIHPVHSLPHRGPRLSALAPPHRTGSSQPDQPPLRHQLSPHAPVQVNPSPLLTSALTLPSRPSSACSACFSALSCVTCI